MDASKIIDKINDQAKGYYQSSIDESAEESKTTNWLLGLAGGALIFSFSRVESIDLTVAPVIGIQALTFVGIIITGYLYRVSIQNFKKTTASVMRLLDFLRFEFDLVPDEVINDLEEGNFNQVYNNYVDGEYFIEDGADKFDGLINDREAYQKQY